MIKHQPVFPAEHGLFGRTVFRVGIIRSDDSVQHSGYRFFRIMFVRQKHIRKHSVKPPAFGIVAPVSWNFDPFVAAILVTNDTVTVITEYQISSLAFRTKKFTALR